MQNPELVQKYPIILTTGRQVEHHGGGAQTRGSKILSEIQPEMYVEINPALANSMGVMNGEMVWVESNQGKVKVKVKVTERVNEKTAFMPYHWAGIFEGAGYEDRYPEGTAEHVLGDSCNIVTAPAYDEITAMQETKVGLCKVYKV